MWQKFVWLGMGLASLAKSMFVKNPSSQAKFDKIEQAATAVAQEVTAPKPTLGEIYEKYMVTTLRPGRLALVTCKMHGQQWEEGAAYGTVNGTACKACSDQVAREMGFSV